MHGREERSKMHGREERSKMHGREERSKMHGREERNKMHVPELDLSDLPTVCLPHGDYAVRWKGMAPLRLTTGEAAEDYGLAVFEVVLGEHAGARFHEIINPDSAGVFWAHLLGLDLDELGDEGLGAVTVDRLERWLGDMQCVLILRLDGRRNRVMLPSVASLPTVGPPSHESAP